MRHTFAFLGRWLAVGLVAGGCGVAPQQPGGLAADPQSAGEIIYRGRVFAAGEDEPSFRYERRVRHEADAIVSTHLTRGADGDVIISQSATHDPAYALTRFEALDAQSGTAGELQVLDDGRVAFDVHGRRRRVEPAGAPVVAGPTLFGWVAVHWDALTGGAALPVRFPVLARARTYAFTLRLENASPTTTTFTMTADSAFVRASVPPMRLVFDSHSRKIVRYEGRVPPKLKRRSRLVDFDARVEYTYVPGERAR